jgi:hypothetical protein
MRFGILLCVTGFAAPAMAAPFAVTALTPEAIQLVDQASIRRKGGTVTYRTILMTQPSPDLGGGKLGHLEETHETRCATGEGRRVAMGAAMTDGEALMMDITDDPWTPMDPSELRVVCSGAGTASVVPSLEAARTALTSAAPPP